MPSSEQPPRPDPLNSPPATTARLAPVDTEPEPDPVPRKRLPDPDPATAKRRARLGILAIVVGIVAFVLIIGLQGGDVSKAESTADQATAKAETLADGYGDLAARVAALCAVGGQDVARDAAGLCSRAQAAVADPIVSNVGLSPDEVRAIAQAAALQQAQGSDPSAAAEQVLAQVRNDPSLQGVSEERARAIAEAAAAQQQATAQPGRDGTAGRNGSSFGGFTRDPADGQCYALITTTAADGTTTTSRQPASDAACAPAGGGGTDPTTDPTTTTEPDPTTTTSEPVPTLPSPVEESSPPPQEGDGLLGGG